ncbi:MAG: hypothetical protein M1832_006164 [Thelocarpon impressellum]|nr:MAG: hypothetical protein M1832_006164 [Thelocarpon impressellum]
MASPMALMLTLSDELLLHIFAFLDVPELLSASRTCHRLRHISIDPILHQRRLAAASATLSHQLTHRPSLSSLAPPTSTIYLTRTHLAARALSRSLVAIRLNRSLSRRPSAVSLVKSNILPRECCGPDGGYGVGAGCISPALIGARRSVERERVKDRLRQQQVGAAKGRELAQNRGWLAAEDADREKERERPSVRHLAARFTRWGRGRDRDGRKRAVEMGPPRAKVLGLRRFWEGVGREDDVHIIRQPGGGGGGGGVP